MYESASKAADAVHPDPRTACFYARRALELAVAWVYKSDATLRLPYQDNLSALIHEPSFKVAAGEAVFNKARVINTLGNRAVHSRRPIQQPDALTAVRELFHFAYWLAHTYARGPRPTADLRFDADALPKSTSLSKQTVDQLKELNSQLRERDEKLSGLLADKKALDEELERLRAEVAEAKKANSAQPDPHDYSEAETRDYFIDLLLKEAGWDLDQRRDREVEVSGMPTQDGRGFVDYVLWGDDGKPLALVEAKRTKKSPQIGQQQAKLYADCLESQFGRRPVIFYSNGYTHWLWDDASYPPRTVQGFFKKVELELMLQRRSSRKRLADVPVNPEIVERYYQKRAIARISEAFETDLSRKALVVMATGAGKTRTVIALCDLLMRCNWVKRVLFLADRIALVNQAVGAFKIHLPDASPVNLVTEKDSEGRVYISTYPTMMGLIEERKDGERKFGVGHFDLVIIDEAHRSVYQKYRAIFEYFDSLLVGLTATPKDEVDFDTYGLFDLERGVPTDAFGLEEAVKDGFLVPAQAVSVPIKFQREGINYDQLPEAEKEQWDAIEWDEEGEVPERIEAQAVNKWLFNKDTVDKVLEHLMTRGQSVAGGDRLGKTIIFAKNQAHAEFIAQRFDVNYPRFMGSFARVIHHGVSYAQTLIDDFSNPSKPPHIAISVDMLDTGIDIHEVVNLVFFKLVRSKTKFWQMLGRGTRLCPDLFGPGKDKEYFYIFDYCQNLEFFSQNPATTEGRLSESLGKRLFKTRLELIGELDRLPEHWPEAHEGLAAEPVAVYGTPLRDDVAGLLHAEVMAMNPENFVVRPKRRLVEKYAEPQAWTTLKEDSLAELAHEVAGLPSEQKPEDEEAKRFDLLILSLQLALLRKERAFQRLRDQVMAIAGLMEEKANIPMVQQELSLIQDVQSEEWWQDVTTAMLENARKRLRELVKLIDKQKRKPIYTDFEDEMGEEAAVDLPGFAAPDTFDRFKLKARHFVQDHNDHIAIHKLRSNKPLNASDLSELEKLLMTVGSAEDVQKAREESQGLGLFVRSLVGLDRGAAKEAFAGFLKDKSLVANQIEFVNLIIDHLTERGVIGAALLYESPFTDVTPHGPDGVFTSDQVDELIGVLNEVRQTAVAA
jgi:type I restriction enzyme R subunit